MRLEDYWGIGPKTRDLLADELGVEAAIEAIESADVRTLTGAGLPSGRATRILRYAHGGEAMDLLATGDARQVYKQLLELLGDYAVSADAADRIRILTPLSSEAAMIERLDDVMEARESWAALTDEEQTAVLTAFEQYDDAGGGDRAAVNAALRLRENGFDSGVFSPLADLDPDDLEDAMAALSGLEGDGDRVGAGAEDRLDSLREQLGSVEDAAATPENLLEEVQQGARGTDELQEELARVVTRETGVDVAQVREAMPTDATDARDFVAGTMRTLASDLRGEVDEREAEVAAELS
ncbi:DNA mismatch repair protein, partial [Halobacteriales archaeon QH_7_66_37]